MITIYLPQLNLVTLDSLKSPATMQVSSRSGMSIAQYRELIKDMELAIEFIESLPKDCATYKANQQRIEKEIDDFNREIYLKWSKM